MKLREMVMKSESLLDMMEEFDEVDEDRLLRSLMFGQFKALTLVVEINSVGRDMRFLLMVPVTYLTLPSRVGIVFSLLSPRLVRFVSARAREAILVSWKMYVAKFVDSKEGNPRASPVLKVKWPRTNEFGDCESECHNG